MTSSTPSCVGQHNAAYGKGIFFDSLWQARLSRIWNKYPKELNYASPSVFLAWFMFLFSLQKGNALKQALVILKNMCTLNNSQISSKNCFVNRWFLLSGSVCPYMQDSENWLRRRCTQLRGLSIVAANPLRTDYKCLHFLCQYSQTFRTCQAWPFAISSTLTSYPGRKTSREWLGLSMARLFSIIECNVSERPGSRLRLLHAFIGSSTSASLSLFSHCPKWPDPSYTKAS